MSSPKPCTGSQAQEPKLKTRTLENDCLVKTLRGEKTARIPIWMMRQSGAHLPEYKEVRDNFNSLSHLYQTPAATTELALQPLRRFKFDAAVVFTDSHNIAHALDIGAQTNTYLQTPQQIAALEFEHVIEKTQHIVANIQDLREAVGRRLPIIGFSSSPWSTACYCIGSEVGSHCHHSKQFSYEHPVAIQDLLIQLSIVTAKYLIQQAHAGADVLLVLDTWGGVLPFSLYESYSLEPLKIIQQTLREHAIDLPLLFFSNGYGPTHNHFFNKYKPCDGLAIDWTNHIAETQVSMYESLCIQGNLDPQVLLAGPLTTQQHTQSMLENVARPNHFIASLGHGVLANTPLESIHAFIDTVHSFKPSHA